MILSVRKMSRVLRLMVFVCLFSFICFKVLTVLQGMLAPEQKYREPLGSDALKVNAVSAQGAGEPAGSLWDEMRARLSVFYQTGE